MFLVARDHFTQAFKPVQHADSGIGFLARVLDTLDDGPIVAVLQQYRHTGRPGYPPRAMLRAYLAKLVLSVRFNTQLLERLRGSRKLRTVCGFDRAVPSESALSRFTDRLSRHRDLLDQCLIEVTAALRERAPKVKKRPGRQDQPLPPLGAVLAIDSTVFRSFSDPNRKVASDPDARWGWKHTTRVKDGDTTFEFGYKMHLISDATHGVPLAFTLTPANAGDSPQLPGLIKKAQRPCPWLQPHYLLADKGYDSIPNHQTLVDLDITPVIHIRRPPTEDGLRDGGYTADGGPTCMGNEPMEYIRTDPQTGHHLFRCRPDGCRLRQHGTKAITHCDTEVWEDPAANLRVIGVLPRSSEVWKRLYRHRMSIERIFRSLKHSRGLEGHCVRGLRKIALLATLSVLTFQMTALGRLQSGDYNRMRRMTVRVV